VGDDQRPTEGDSRLRGTREPVNKRLMYEPRDLEHNALTDWLAASATAVTPV